MAMATDPVITSPLDSPIQAEPVSSRSPPAHLHQSLPHSILQSVPPPLHCFSTPLPVNPLSVNFSYAITVKLNEDNFLVWKQQVEPVLKAHRLHHYLNNSKIPPQFLSMSNRVVGIENPAYNAWELQDHLLLSWIQSSLSESFLTRVVGCRYSWQIWTKFTVISIIRLRPRHASCEQS